MNIFVNHLLKTIATLLDVSGRRFQQLSREGAILESQHGFYELVPAVQVCPLYLRDRSAHPGMISRDVARQGEIATWAKLAEIEIARARADLVAIINAALRAQHWCRTITAECDPDPAGTACFISVFAELRKAAEFLTDKRGR